ncbi:hypothetical protein VTJ04DRAFT_4105 [Mycothermus thermophilus]|uniref:uncharacterized protein n=1 Tax=Humicola insolens TaxID=85995 RepID=UPI00374265B0
MTSPPFNIPTKNYDEWRKALAKIKIADQARSVAVAHVQTDFSAPWMSQFILNELFERVKDRRANRPRVIYVLPDEGAVAVARELFVRDPILKDTIVRTYCGLIEDIKNKAEHVLCAVVVIDMNFRHESTAAVVAAATLLRYWSQVRAIGTAITVSCERDMVWSADDIKTKFGTAVVRVALVPRVKYNHVNMTVKHKRTGGERIVRALEFAFRKSRASAASTVVFVVCLAPAVLGRTIRLRSHDGVAVKTLVVTPKTLPDAAAKARDLAESTTPTSVVVFVDPAVRFLPPLPGISHVVMLGSWPVEWWSSPIEAVAEFERPCDLMLAALAAGLGQGSYNDKVTVLCVSGVSGSVVHSLDLLPPAWGRHAPETMLCMARLADPQVGLHALGVAFPAHDYFSHSIMLSLVRPRLIRIMVPDAVCPHRTAVRINSDVASNAADLLISGFTTDLVESLLIAQMQNQSSPGARFLLAMLASVLHVGPAGILSPRPSAAPQMAKIKEVCHPGWKPLMNKGRLWILAAVLAASNVDFGLVGGTQADVVVALQDLGFLRSKDEFEAVGHRFKDIYRRLQQTCVASMPTADDIRVVEIILVKACLKSLGACEQGEVAEIGDLRTGIPIQYTSTCGWGEGLRAWSGGAVGVYHALRHDGETYSTDWVTLVDDQSWVEAMRDLFPNVPPQEWQSSLGWACSV